MQGFGWPRFGRRFGRGVGTPEGPGDPAPAVSGALWSGHHDATSAVVTASMIQGTDEVRFAAVPASGPTR